MKFSFSISFCDDGLALFNNVFKVLRTRISQRSCTSGLSLRFPTAICRSSSRIGRLSWVARASPVMKSRRVLCLLHDDGLEAAARQAQ